jgi:hypothetical protein
MPRSRASRLRPGLALALALLASLAGGGPRAGAAEADAALVPSFKPGDQIDCAKDPQAGTKIMWNVQSGGGDGQASFFYSYWDRGEQRKGAFGAEVIAPFDARGIQLLTYRYKDSDKPRNAARNDDTWVYVPTLRRVRRISAAQRTDAISGTDFTFDDLRSFNGSIPQYEWKCIGRRKLIAPMNSEVKGYPYAKDHNFGPYGLSYAGEGWELRDAVDWLPGWPAVPNPRTIVVVSDTIVNAQTGTGNRIEFWDAQGTPLPTKGKIRRYIDVGRLTKGR